MHDRPSIHQQSILPPLRALLQQRVEGDDALLQLAQLRFAQAGLAAEVYADTPEQLDRVLGFIPSHRYLPVVHLNRGVNVLQARGRAVVEAFAARFAGRVWALVVHDKAEMVARENDLLAAMRELGTGLSVRPEGPYLFLEYAAGLELGWFVEVAERLREVEQRKLLHRRRPHWYQAGKPRLLRRAPWPGPRDPESGGRTATGSGHGRPERGAVRAPCGGRGDTQTRTARQAPALPPA